MSQITTMVWSLIQSQTFWCVNQVGLRKCYSEESQWRCGIPAELFKILKNDAVKVLHSVCQQFGKAQQQPQYWKRSVSFQSQGKVMPKNVQTTKQLCSLHMLEVNAQTSSSQFTTICEPRTSRYTCWIQKRQRNQSSNCQHPVEHGKSKKVPEKHLFLLY